MSATDGLVKLAVVSLLLSTVALMGCGGGGGGNTVVTGRVVDDGTLQPLAGARVAVPGDDPVTANAAGEFTIHVSAPVTLSAAKAGYLTATVEVPDVSGAYALGDVYLSPSPMVGYGTIRGAVTLGGLPNAGATLQAAGRTGVSKPDGSYAIHNVLAGDQTIVAQSADRRTAGSNVATVPDMGTVTAYIALTTQPPAPPPL